MRKRRVKAIFLFCLMLLSFVVIAFVGSNYLSYRAIYLSEYQSAKNVDLSETVSGIIAKIGNCIDCANTAEIEIELYGIYNQSQTLQRQLLQLYSSCRSFATVTESYSFVKKLHYHSDIILENTASYHIGYLSIDEALRTFDSSLSHCFYGTSYLQDTIQFQEYMKQELKSFNQLYDLLEEHDVSQAKTAKELVAIFFCFLIEFEQTFSNELSKI